MVVLLGDAGCGKSCALKRFAEDTWLDEGPTIGVEMRMRSLLVRAKHTVVRLQLWDASGAELGGSGAELGGPSSLDSMCVGVHGVVVMYDAQNRSSFLSVPKWIERAEALAPHNASRLLLGTKYDKYDSKPASDDAAAAAHRSARGARGAPAPSRATPERVDAREASRLASSHKMLFAAASALEGSGIDEAFAMLAEHLLATREGSDAEAEQRLAEVAQDVIEERRRLSIELTAREERAPVKLLDGQSMPLLLLLRGHHRLCSLGCGFDAASPSVRIAVKAEAAPVS
jgi:GTPase SAR1 family protein